MSVDLYGHIHVDDPPESQGVERAQPVETTERVEEGICDQCGGMGESPLDTTCPRCNGSGYALKVVSAQPVERYIPVLDAEPSQPSEAKATLTTEGRTGTANVPTGAQPVEGPREKCAHTLKTWWKGEGWIQRCTKCGLYFDPSETPSEPADDYRVTVDASYLKSLLRRPPAPVEGPQCESRLLNVRCMHAPGHGTRHMSEDGSSWSYLPATPAESQGVERAQPVEGPREKCEWCHNPIRLDPGKNGWAHATGYIWCRTDDGDWERAKPMSVIKNRTTEKGREFWDHVEAIAHPAAPVEGVERVTDDRPAETIRSKPYNSADELARSVEELLAENARAETRIEVLEAALRYLINQGVYPRSLSGSGDCGDHCGNSCPWCEARAALPAPSGEKEKV